MPAPIPARAYAVTSAGVHAVVGICRRCVDAETRLPRSARQKRINRAADRALGHPARYYCTVFEDRDAVALATGMLGMKDLAQETVEALGWG